MYGVFGQLNNFSDFWASSGDFLEIIWNSVIDVTVI